MKVVIIIAVLLVLFAVFSPLVVLNMKEEPRFIEEEQEEQESVDTEIEKHEILQNTGCNVNVLMGDETVTMDIEEYLVGVVAGEMPVSFEVEALRAQAVAARTYTLHKLWVEPSANHDADVCTDPACCKAYADEESLRESWGGDFEINHAKIVAAVWETQGTYMVYDDEPVLAVFHSSSSGATENSGNVWNRDIPYLVSVTSPEDADEVKDYISTTEISYGEFKEIFLQKYPDAQFSDDTDTWITDIVYSESGRINSAVVGGVAVRGTEIRGLYGLRSTAVSVAMGAKGVVFTATGYGHGVGMSQYGANCMAQEGKTWQEILKWYYSGIEFSSLLYTI